MKTMTRACVHRTRRGTEYACVTKRKLQGDRKKPRQALDNRFPYPMPESKEWADTDTACNCG